MINTELAQLNSLSETEISRLYELMRHAYEVTEREIWGPNYTRMPKGEYIALIRSGNIVIARLNGQIVGSIAVYHLQENEYAFGLLSADFSKKGLGIGRALIAHAEQFAREKGAAIMSLEILKPLEFEVPEKTILRDWYQRLGYDFIESMLFEERKPDKVEKAKLLIVPSVFDCYSKQL